MKKEIKFDYLFNKIVKEKYYIVSMFGVINSKGRSNFKLNLNIKFNIPLGDYTIRQEKIYINDEELKITSTDLDGVVKHYTDYGTIDQLKFYFMCNVLEFLDYKGRYDEE